MSGLGPKGEGYLLRFMQLLGRGGRIHFFFFLHFLLLFNYSYNPLSSKTVLKHWVPTSPPNGIWPPVSFSPKPVDLQNYRGTDRSPMKTSHWLLPEGAIFAMRPRAQVGHQKRMGAGNTSGLEHPQTNSTSSTSSLFGRHPLFCGGPFLTSHPSLETSEAQSVPFSALCGFQRQAPRPFAVKGLPLY